MSNTIEKYKKQEWFLLSSISVQLWFPRPRPVLPVDRPGGPLRLRPEGGVPGGGLGAVLLRTTRADSKDGVSGFLFLKIYILLTKSVFFHVLLLDRLAVAAAVAAVSAVFLFFFCRHLLFLGKKS